MPLSDIFAGSRSINPDDWKVGGYISFQSRHHREPFRLCSGFLGCQLRLRNFPAGSSKDYGQRLRVIVVGANDGQFHAFKALDGSEVWELYPPQLPAEAEKYRSYSHPVGLTHQYFVDGFVSGADVCWGRATAPANPPRTGRPWWWSEKGGRGFSPMEFFRLLRFGF